MDVRIKNLRNYMFNVNLVDKGYSDIFTRPNEDFVTGQMSKVYKENSIPGGIIIEVLD